MPLIETDTVNLHLRVDGTAEDVLVQTWIAAAEQQVAQFLGRKVFEDADTLAAAIAAAPTALAAAVATHDAAITAACAMADGVAKDAAIRYADEALATAMADSDTTQRGMVVNESIRSAILLAVANLYEHRGEDAAELPIGARSLLQPFRVMVV